jgi:hypothetical protein
MNQQQQIQNQNALTSIYQNGAQDPFGIQGGFLDKANPITTFEEEIEKMRKESEMLDRMKVKTEFSLGGLTTSFEVPVNMMLGQ